MRHFLNAETQRRRDAESLADYAQAFTQPDSSPNSRPVYPALIHVFALALSRSKAYFRSLIPSAVSSAPLRLSASALSLLAAALLLAADEALTAHLPVHCTALCAAHFAYRCDRPDTGEVIQ